MSLFHLVTLFTFHSLLLTLVSALAFPAPNPLPNPAPVPVPQAVPPPAPTKWTLTQRGTTGVSAMLLSMVSPTLAIVIDRVENNPLRINGNPAWAALYNLRTDTVTPLALRTNTFCAAGTFLSNGTLVNVGGSYVEQNEPGGEGWQGIRLFGPCKNANGTGCTVFDDPKKLRLREKRWYPSVIRLQDGSLFIVGGMSTSGFWNDRAQYNIDSYEYYPPKGNGNPIYSPFLNRTSPVNLFPITFLLPDGTIFMAAGNKAIIYNRTANSERRLPDIPKGVRISYPMTGSGVLLPLSPPNYTPEVLICGGSNTSITLKSSQMSAYTPASQFCFRMVLNSAGIAGGWRTETMPERRVMPDTILMPNGQVVIVNGATAGVAGYGNVPNAIGASNAANPAFSPTLYTPTITNSSNGARFSKTLMPTSKIPRLYHSTASLTPMGNIMIAGSNPNNDVTTRTYPTEYRVEWLNPLYMSRSRPVLSAVPEKMLFGSSHNLTISIPSGLNTTASKIQVALMDLGFATHSLHNTDRLVWLTSTLTGGTLRVTAPPNGRVYPPGPAWIFVTVDGVTSEGAMTLIGSGGNPPIAS